MANKLSDSYQLSAKTATATGGSYEAGPHDGSLHVFVFSASTSTATVLVEQSVDGTNWFTAQTISNPSSTGSYLIGPVAPFNRVRVSAYSAGTVSALLSTMALPATQWKAITATDQIISAGGSDTQLQYNSNGSLAGMTATWDGSTLALTGAATVSSTLNVTGAVTGASFTGTLLGAQKDTLNVYSGDGAITVAPQTAALTKGTAGAYTLAAPTATTHDGYIIRLFSTTAAAHVVTFASGKINGGSNVTITLGGAIGDGATLVAYNGVWWTTAKINATVA